MQRQLTDEEEKYAPSSFFCQISFEIMQNPKMTPAGYSYEEEAIKAWILKKGTEPITKQPLKIEDLRDDITLKNAISEWFEINLPLIKQICLLKSELHETQTLLSQLLDQQRSEYSSNTPPLEPVKTQTPEGERNAPLKPKARVAPTQRAMFTFSDSDDESETNPDDFPNIFSPVIRPNK